MSTIKTQKWWIKFNEKSGRIYQVSPKELILQPGLNKNIMVSKNPLCIKILTGKVSIKECTVIWDFIENEWKLDKKGTIVVLDTLSNELFEIQEKPPSNSDIYLRCYTNENVITVSIHYENIKHSMNLSDITDITKDSKSLNLYFCKRNDPDSLVASVDVDPHILFKEKTIEIDVSKVFKNIGFDWKNLSIFTRPIFNNYSMEFLEEKIKTDAVEDKSNILQTVTVGDNVPAHLKLNVDGRKLTILSKLNTKTEYILRRRKVLQFFVCDTDVDNIVGRFHIPQINLLSEENLALTLDFDFPKNPKIIYKNKELAVNYMERK
tara:strand:- start:644 stop:1606 length:963 start_codon:yes stop_codon:yes gene_type:complete